jgi:hypothetical protein
MEYQSIEIFSTNLCSLDNTVAGLYLRFSLPQWDLSQNDGLADDKPLGVFSKPLA